MNNSAALMDMKGRTDDDRFSVFSPVWTGEQQQNLAVKQLGPITHKRKYNAKTYAITVCLVLKRRFLFFFVYQIQAKHNEVV